MMVYCSDETGVITRSEIKGGNARHLTLMSSPLKKNLNRNRYVAGDDAKWGYWFIVQW